MSPYLAVGRRPALRGRPVFRGQRAAGVRLKIKRQQRRTRTASANYALPMSGEHYLSGGEGLGFSLKPPKFVRKAAKSVGHAVGVAARAVKKNVTLKRALIAGAIVGTAFIPGVGPAAMAAARGAAKYGAKAFHNILGRPAVAIAHGVEGLFKRKPGETPGTPPIAEPSGTYGPPAPTADQGGGGGGGGTYGPSPDQGGEPSGGGGSYGGGGGGGYSPAPEPDAGAEPAPMPEATAATDDEAATAPPATAGALPILLGLGTIALLAKAAKARR